MASAATLTPNPSPQGRGACQVMRPDPVFGRNDLRQEAAVRPSPLRRGVGGEGRPLANITRNGATLTAGLPHYAAPIVSVKKGHVLVSRSFARSACS